VLGVGSLQRERKSRAKGDLLEERKRARGSEGVFRGRKKLGQWFGARYGERKITRHLKWVLGDTGRSSRPRGGNEPVKAEDSGRVTGREIDKKDVGLQIGACREK